MRKHVKLAFQKPDRLIAPDATDIHERALGRVLITVIALLVMAIVGTIELRLPPELRVGYFESSFTSP
ncbi:MAG: hypothetical protein JSR91_27435 [Proteobacteria bacterium]|nr:hypothetical protein [Pseudomonadota bacterium]